MGKKAQAKKLRQLAGTLPIVMERTCETHYVKGVELLKQGHSDINGKPIEGHKEYIQQMPVKIAMNHGRRMKRLMQRGGVDAVKQYMESINNLK